MTEIVDDRGRGVSAVASRIAWPAIVFGLTVVIFLPSIRYGFSNLDDPRNFIDNVDYRGLTWRNFVWFFTTYHMGHYQPLNWLTFAVDFQISGVDAGRFRLTQILLHAVGAVCVYWMTIRLTALAHERGNLLRLRWTGAAAALFFALHPLRVESVVWASARTDVLACIFSALAVLAYLKAAERRPERRSHRLWLVASLVAFLAAVLTKEMAVTLPVILILLDVYPLKRLPSSAMGWLGRECRAVWVEKVPFFVVSTIFAMNAFFAAGASVATLEDAPAAMRVAQALYSFAFYLRKTVLPINLSPLYEIPGEFSLMHRWVIVSVAFLVFLSIVVWRFHSRAPGLMVVAIAYLVLLLPVSGLTPRGPQLVADRYSYLGCIPLLFPLVHAILRLASRWPRLVGIMALAALTGLAAMTAAQMSIWESPISLWKHAIRMDAHNGTAHASLAHAYELAGRPDDAVREYQTALRIRPTQPDAHRNLAAIFNRQNRNHEAIEHYLADLKQNPRRIESHYYLGATYDRIGEKRLAEERYREALRLDPRFVLAHIALARLDLSRGRLPQGEAGLRHALFLDQKNAAAMELLAKVCAETGRNEEALQWYDRAIARTDESGKKEAARALRELRNQLAKGPASRPVAP